MKRRELFLLKGGILHSGLWKSSGFLALIALLVVYPPLANCQTKPEPFQLIETTIERVHAAYKSGQLTSHQLVQLYLNRIEAYDKNGPKINAIINLNPKALEDADKLDASFKTSGLVGPLHGIPIIIKDQVDAKGMPTTLGSVLLKDYYPEKDAFVVEKLRKAGAIILAKGTLGELGGGDTYGTLFGVTRNPYALDRTVGGSSGGPGASISSNFAMVAVGQEGSASIRRPSTWNDLVGMRPTAGLVSRSGVSDGWPYVRTSLGPMARTVRDLATLLDVMVGYDSEDPVTAYGVGHVSGSYTNFLDPKGLKGSRLGILRESIGMNSEPNSEDFRNVSEIFDKAVGELKAAGAEAIDPIVIPNIRELLAKNAMGPEVSEAYKVYLGRNANAPFKSLEELVQAPDFRKVIPPTQQRLTEKPDPSKHYQYLLAKDELMANLLKVMADHKLDAIVFKSVEHQPTLIRDGVNPPYVGSKGVSQLNTFLVFVPAITVPAGFTKDELPIGITFLGRPYSDGAMIKLAFAYEQATHHRRPPSTVPSLP